MITWTTTAFDLFAGHIQKK